MKTFKRGVIVNFEPCPRCGLGRQGVYVITLECLLLQKGSILGHLKIGDCKQAEKQQIFAFPWDGNETHFVYFWVTCYTALHVAWILSGF